MINDECINEVKDFLRENPSPSIRTASTMKDGFVACIGPVKTVCGPELMCSPKTKQELAQLVRAV